MKYNVFILEDEKSQQELLTGLVTEHFTDFQIQGIASNVQEGKEWLAKNTADLVFMDVMLPPYTSFDLLKALPSTPFEIIFTTSFEEYAIQAFRLAAIDYLLKPVALEELRNALEKFKQKKAEHDSALHIKHLLSNLSLPQPNLSKIALPTLTGFIFITVKDIIRCESDNTYTTFFTSDKRKIVVSKTLKECEQMLGGYNFFRVHNSHLINMEYISEYVKGEGGVIKLSDGSHVDVSRRRKEEFIRQLKKV